MIINGLEGTPINIDDGTRIQKINDELTTFLHEVNRRSGYMIWGRPDNFYELITGSFGEAIRDVLEEGILDWDQGVDKINVINDIDVMIPIGGDIALCKALTEMGVPHKKISTQVHSIVKFDDQWVQVDFTIKSLRMAPNEFTEKTAFWRLRDRELGIKSVYYQLLLGSLTAVNHDVDALSISYGLRVRNDDPENRQYETNMDAIIRRLLNIEKIDGVDALSIYMSISNVWGICFLMNEYLDDAAINRVLAKFEHRLEGFRKTEKYNKEQEVRVWKVIDQVLEGRAILGKSHAPST